MSTSGPSACSSAQVGQKPVDAGEAVRRDGGAAPLDHIAVVVIVRRLDENDPERPLSHCPPCSAARGDGPCTPCPGMCAGSRPIRIWPRPLGSLAAIVPVLIRRSKKRSEAANRVHARREARADGLEGPTRQEATASALHDDPPRTDRVAPATRSWRLSTRGWAAQLRRLAYCRTIGAAASG